MFDGIDESQADTLLNPEEHEEVAHIQRHVELAGSEEDKARLAWRATSIYLAAFAREINRLRDRVGVLTQGHLLADCSCRHHPDDHMTAVICAVCWSGEPDPLAKRFGITH